MLLALAPDMTRIVPLVWERLGCVTISFHFDLLYDMTGFFLKKSNVTKTNCPRNVA
jgi:hypothetical protein